MHKKLNLPKKICKTCKLEFTWEKNGKKIGTMFYIVQRNVKEIL